VYSSLLLSKLLELRFIGKADQAEDRSVPGQREVPVCTSHVLCAKQVVHGCHVASRIGTSTMTILGLKKKKESLD
jgi:hypothetical protein